MLNWKNSLEKQLGADLAVKLPPPPAQYSDYWLPKRCSTKLHLCYHFADFVFQKFDPPPGSFESFHWVSDSKLELTKLVAKRLGAAKQLVHLVAGSKDYLRRGANFDTPPHNSV
jgi:hypothetical protein